MTVVSLSHQAPPAKPGAAMDKPIERKRCDGGPIDNPLPQAGRVQRCPHQIV